MILINPRIIRISTLIIFVLVLLEISCHAVLTLSMKAWMVSVVYLVAGFGVVGIILFGKFSYTNQGPLISQRWIVGLMFLLTLMVEDIAGSLFDIWPLDYRDADMLPVIDIMSHRLIHGGDIYALIPEIWGGMQPIYLPAMWLPYVLPTLCDIDMRWASVIWMLVGTFVLMVPWKRGAWHLMSLMAFMSMVLYLWIMWLYLDPGVIALTEEGIVFGYYALLCIAIISWRPYMIGVAIGLCLLSRYMIAPWVLVMLLTLWLCNSRQDAYKMVVAILITGITLMTVGQGWSALPIFMFVPDNYLASVLADYDKYHPLIDSSLGLAKFWPYDALGSCHMLMKVMAVLSPLLSFPLLRSYASHLPFRLHALIAMKISLILFFNLLIMPYGYLFYTSSIVSLALLSYILIFTSTHPDTSNTTAHQL